MKDIGESKVKKIADIVKDDGREIQHRPGSGTVKTPHQDGDALVARLEKSRSSEDQREDGTKNEDKECLHERVDSFDQEKKGEPKVFDDVKEGNAGRQTDLFQFRLHGECGKLWRREGVEQSDCEDDGKSDKGDEPGKGFEFGKRECEKGEDFALVCSRTWTGSAWSDQLGNPIDCPKMQQKEGEIKNGDLKSAEKRERSFFRKERGKENGSIDDEVWVCESAHIEYDFKECGGNEKNAANTADGNGEDRIEEVRYAFHIIMIRREVRIPNENTPMSHHEASEQKEK